MIDTFSLGGGTFVSISRLTLVLPLLDDPFLFELEPQDSSLAALSCDLDCVVPSRESSHVLSFELLVVVYVCSVLVLGLFWVKPMVPYVIQWGGL